MKYKFSAGHYRPFIDAGASLRHITSITEKTYLNGSGTPILNDNSMALLNRNSAGGVFGVGADFVWHRFHLSPEARYTRWFNEAFRSTNGQLHTELNQVDLLVGLTF